MLNLRQLNSANNAEADSDAQHLSQFSVDFRVPSNFLGNIGEPLDHGQSERSYEDGHYDRYAGLEKQIRVGVDLESPELATTPSGTLPDDEPGLVCLHSAASVAGVAGSSGSSWD